VKVRNTGADLALDRVLIGECLVWLGYHMIIRARAAWVAVSTRRRPRMWFAPHTPRPWYLIWSACAWAGVAIASTPEEADAAFAFEDATWRQAVVPPRLPAFNYRCRDISKTRVATVFEQVFGYALAIDPAGWAGPAVEKSELNGAHDGRVIDCPAQRQPGRSYQRLIDGSDGAFAYDLRAACIGRKPVLVWIKKKPAGDRFSIHNLSVTLHRPETVFSAAELADISRFAGAMHLDWGALDIIRHRKDGRIYIVDVNPTDIGPIIALPLRDKLRSTAILAQALREMVTAAGPTGSGAPAKAGAQIQHPTLLP
jgi:hypothetical protein